jgi:hypothetical protein
MRKISFFGLLAIGILLFGLLMFPSCQSKQEKNMKQDKKPVEILFLHHSTGKIIWSGDNSLIQKVKGKLNMPSAVEKWFTNYNRKQGVDYRLTKQAFPKKEPYGWKNYPYDYYNIWVKNGHLDYFMEEPTLKTLTQSYQVIIFKHCYPGARIEADTIADIDSEVKTLANYKLQYQALKEEMHKYPQTRFLVWTPAALTQSRTNEQQAMLTREFVNWVKTEWNEPGDNIFVWDFYDIETEGGLYLKEEYAQSSSDSHPNALLAQKAYPSLCQRIVDVIEDKGDL